MLENWQQLELDLRSQILVLDAVPRGELNRFGDVYKICADLVGPNGVCLSVVTIWMVEFETGVTKFITLYPNREGN